MSVFYCYSDIVRQKARHCLQDVGSNIQNEMIMTQKYLIADEAAAYLNISRARFFDFRRFIPAFPKPIKIRLNEGRPRLVWTPEQLDTFSLSFWGDRSHG